MFSRLMSINNHLYWLITTYTGPPLSLPPISLQKEFCDELIPIKKDLKIIFISAHKFGLGKKKELR